MSKVSILVPCFNVQEYLPRCLETIRLQTLRDIEVLCINDGSTDGTKQIIKEYCKLDGRFKLIDKVNTGYGDSMNLGISMARGQYIGIVESDDFVEPKMFEKLYQNAIRYDLDVCRCNYFFHQSGNDRINKNSFIPTGVVLQPSRCWSVFKHAPSIWVNLYKRAWLLENRISFLPTPGASYQDISFSFKTFYCATAFFMLDEPLLHYRIDNMNSSIHSKGKELCVCDEWSELFKFAQKKDINFNRLIPLMHRTYLWNLGRLKHQEQKNIFLDEWQKMIKNFIKGNKIVLSQLPVIDLVLVLTAAYIPVLLKIYKNKGFLYRKARKIYE